MKQFKFFPVFVVLMLALSSMACTVGAAVNGVAVGPQVQFSGGAAATVQPTNPAPAGTAAATQDAPQATPIGMLACGINNTSDLGVKKVGDKIAVDGTLANKEIHAFAAQGSIDNLTVIVTGATVYGYATFLRDNGESNDGMLVALPAGTYTFNQTTFSSVNVKVNHYWNFRFGVIPADCDFYLTNLMNGRDGSVPVKILNNNNVFTLTAQ